VTRIRILIEQTLVMPGAERANGVEYDSIREIEMRRPLFPHRFVPVRHIKNTRFAASAVKQERQRDNSQTPVTRRQPLS